jgi:hypothetical protein
MVMSTDTLATKEDVDDLGFVVRAAPFALLRKWLALNQDVIIKSAFPPSAADRR